MNSQPTVSIVLPVHNGARYLDEAIESVVAQTYTDWELILVDDASTDKTPKRIAHWAAQDERISAVYLKTNRKLPGALNEGFRHARGELFTWTSDDNWYSPEAIEKMVEVLESRDDVDLVYARSTLMNADGAFTRFPELRPPKDLALTNCVGACFLYRRKVHEALGGYDETLFLAEDYDFWLRAYLDFRFATINSLLYFYRCHDASLTERRAHDISTTTERALLRWVENRDKLKRSERGHAFEAMGYRALMRGDLWKGRKMLLRATDLLFHPPRFHKCRSYAFDCFFGRRAGEAARRRRPPPTE